jgi:predicted permease
MTVTHMRRFRAAVVRVTRLFCRGRLERELAAEMESHLQLHIDDNLKAGMTPAEARRQAIIALGGIEQTKERYRDRRGLPSLEAFLQDVRFAGRMFRKQRAFTLAALSMLTIGLALTAGGYTVFNGLFVRGWAVPDADQVFRVGAARKVQPPAGTIYDGLSMGAYKHISAHAKAAEYVAFLADYVRLRASRSDDPVYTAGIVASENLVTALRIPMQLGTSRFHIASSPPPIIISDKMWRRIFGGDPTVVGRTAWLRDNPVTIAGVTAAGFEGLGERPLDVIIPISAIGQATTRPSSMRLLDDAACCVAMAGRLREGSTEAQALGELEILTAQYRQSVREPALSVRLVSTVAAEQILRGEDGFVTALALVSIGVMLIFVLTCTNVGNLFLARSISRRGEIAVRLSLGATRTRIVQQLVTEGLVLASVAGAVAFAATMSVPPLLRLVENGATAAMFASDWRVAAFTSVFVILTCLIISLAPALHTSRIAWRGAGVGAGVGEATGKLRRGILAAQIAVATVLVLSATLLTRGIERALAIPADFALRTTTAATIQPPEGPWDAANARETRSALARAARDSDMPIGLAALDPGGSRGLSIGRTRVRKNQSEAQFEAELVPLAEDAAQVLGLRLAAGRWPSSDPAKAEAVVNRTLAEAMWSGTTALGRALTVDYTHRTYTIVGIAQDAHLTAFDHVAPIVHIAGSELPLLVARTSRDVDAQLKRLIASVDPELIVTVMPLSQPFEETLNEARIGAAVAGGLAAVAIALAIVGIFSVFAYLVEERRQEIGVRLALGASRKHVGLAIFHATRNAVGGGLLVGLGLSVAAGIALRGFLFGLSPVDPVSYAIVAIILVASAAIATAIPVRRAVRIAPVTALRAE